MEKRSIFEISILSMNERNPSLPKRKDGQENSTTDLWVEIGKFERDLRHGLSESPSLPLGFWVPCIRSRPRRRRRWGEGGPGVGENWRQNHDWKRGAPGGRRGKGVGKERWGRVAREGEI